MAKPKKSLQSILGFTSSGRVKKTSSPATSSPATSQSPRASPRKRRPSTPKAGPGPGSGGGGGEGSGGAGEDVDEEEVVDYFQDHLDDHGLVRALVTDLHLSDVVQTMRFIRGRMWTPMPDRRTGMSSARVSEVLNYRLNVPPAVTVAHLQAVLTASPSAVEREVAGLVEKGIVRRVVVRGRSEAVVEVGDLVEMVARADVDEGSRATYVRFLRGEIGSEGLEGRQVDVLVKAGFLTSSYADSRDMVSRGGSRPAAGLLGTTRTLAHLAMAPTGSLDAVGGGAIQMVTGSGAPSTPSNPPSTSSTPPSSEALSISVPGNGAFIKLVKASVEHLVSLLERRSAYREMPEYALREAWDGGLATGSGGKRARGEISGVLPGKTRKWRGHWGLRFEWVLEEAVGAGLVEVFETGSVGRGVRAL